MADRAASMAELVAYPESGVGSRRLRPLNAGKCAGDRPSTG